MRVITYGSTNGDVPVSPSSRLRLVRFGVGRTGLKRVKCSAAAKKSAPYSPVRLVTVGHVSKPWFTRNENSKFLSALIGRTEVEEEKTGDYPSRT